MDFFIVMFGAVSRQHFSNLSRLALQSHTYFTKVFPPPKNFIIFMNILTVISKVKYYLIAIPSHVLVLEKNKKQSILKAFIKIWSILIIISFQRLNCLMKK